jgi:predicted nucleic acid-binding protein
MKTKIYLDTSVISALFDKRTPERLTMTADFWSKLIDYEVFISELVLEELKRANVQIRNRMLSTVENFNILYLSERAENLAKTYVKQGIFPEKYFDDALHVALASENQISVLISWNFTHLVKLKTRRMVSVVNLQKNFMPVEIISPPEL